MTKGKRKKRNVTVSLDRQTIQKAKIIAARRRTSLSSLLAQQIETIVGIEETYAGTERQAIALLEQGFRLCGAVRHTRVELHGR